MGLRSMGLGLMHMLATLLNPKKTEDNIRATRKGRMRFETSPGRWKAVWPTSKAYIPFSGKQECARRRRQLIAWKHPSHAVMGGDLIAARTVALKTEYPLTFREAA